MTYLPIVVKVQLSLASSDGIRRVLIYSRDRSVRHEEAATPEVVAAMAGRDKLFCRARVAADGMLDLWLEDTVPDEDW